MSLPNEIISHIIEYLNYDGFKSFILVNKNFYKLSRYITKHYKYTYEKAQLLMCITESLHVFKTIYYTCKIKHTEEVFHFACENNSVNIVKFLINKVGENPIIEQVNGMYIYQDIKLVKIFVEQGIDISGIMEEFNQSLLIHLCKYGSLEVVKYFSEKENILNDVNNMNYIARRIIFMYDFDEDVDILHLVPRDDERKEICLFLLENGAVLNETENREIGARIEKNDLFFIETYLKYKLIDNINFWLEFACLKRSLEIVELFIKYGAVSRPGVYDSIEKEHFNTVKFFRQYEKIDAKKILNKRILDAIINYEHNVLNYCLYYYDLDCYFSRCVDMAWRHKNVHAVYQLFKHRNGLNMVVVNAIKNNYEDLIGVIKRKFKMIDNGGEYLKIAFKYKRFNILNIIKNHLEEDEMFEEWCEQNKHLKVVKYLKKN